MSATRLPDHYFEKKYADDPDPWGFEHEWYEKRKYDLTLASLPLRTYRRAFEPGCANGVLTARLAERVDALVASDPIEACVERARARVPAHVRVDVGALPETVPDGTFDLVLASECLYYLEPKGFEMFEDWLECALEPGGHLLAVHWRLETDYPLRGDAVHERLRVAPFLNRMFVHEEREFVLEIFERRR